LDHLKEIFNTECKFTKKKCFLIYHDRDEAEKFLKNYDGGVIDGLRVQCRFMTKEDEKFMP
jgi:hypothetical protein